MFIYFLIKLKFLVNVYIIQNSKSKLQHLINNKK